ncbi:MAG: LysR family transcriptional regulator [Alcanivoracaceae bacterium]|nr:LysR family transcriptional regulator [Alcanivoracaceae bacterium]|tara:strand:- start:4538 stop:5428 length:891 start_codon:yes stop_codon:yes gene_type:complete
MRNQLPNLNLLLTFEAAAQFQSFKDAAETLHVTPSAVSQQISLLEENLGVKLFDRKNRALSLTDDGQKYFSKIAPHINGLRKATEALKANQSKPVKISVMPPVAGRLVLPKLNDFRDRFPDVDLAIETSISNTNLVATNTDIAIRFGQPPWAGLNHEKIADVSALIIMPPGFTEQYNLKGDITRLEEIPLVNMTGRPGAWKRFFDQLGLCDSRGSQYYVDDYPAAVQAAESLGAALALYPVEMPLVESGRVEAPFPPIGPLDEAIYAVYPNNKSLPVGGREFIDWLKNKLDEIEER